MAVPSTTSRILDRWARHHTRALRVGVASLAVIAAVWLGYEFWRLLDGPNGGIDLRLRRREIRAWYGHEPVYGGNSNAVYPPASYLLMAPFFGWESPAFARALWALVSAATLFVLVRQVVRTSGARTRAERAFVALVPLATYAVGATIGNGQVGIVVVSALIAGFSLLAEPDRSLWRDVAVGALMLVALVKPSISAFFFWPLLFARGGLRPAVITAAGYAGLTWVASLWREAGPLELMRAWARRGAAGARWGARQGEGAIAPASITGPAVPAGAGDSGAELAVDVLRIKSVNLHSLLAHFRVADWSMIASFALLVVFGIWVWRYRRSSVWTLMGVTGIVVLFSGYHAWYDHVLILLPVIALLRIAEQGTPWGGRLFLGLLLFSLAPGGLYLLPYPFNNAYVLTQAGIWLVVLGYLGGRAAQEHSAA